MIAILGAGVTGLAAARTLAQAGVPYQVLEREPKPGGYARSTDVEGFGFDCSGHLLHVGQAETRALIQRHLPRCFAEHERRAEVFLCGRRVPYPFQAHLGALPRRIAAEALAGFEQALARGPRARPRGFVPFVRAAFGDPMGQLFFFPYNEKVFARSLHGITAEWTTWSVPVPDPAAIRAGARNENQESYGYNAHFLYPRRTGIDILPRRLARGLEGLRLGVGVRCVDTRRKQIELENGERVPYRRLISTLPLNELLRRLDPAPPERRAWLRALTASRMLVLNLGVVGPPATDAHWVYYPEPRFSFLRVGTYTNFASHLTPAGHHSLYVEVGFRGRADLDALARRARRDLVQAGVIRRQRDIVVEQRVVLDPAYVDYTVARARVLPGILRALKRRGILTAGRYARWEYGSMDSSMAQGVRAAQTLLG